MMKIKKQKKWGGFSFIESMFSVAILSIGIIAAISLMSSGLNDAIDGRNQVIGAMLAQEGVELVQNFRDNNWASGNESFDGGAFPNVDKDNCIVSYDGSDVKTCNNGINTLKLNVDGSGYYTHSGGSPTIFSRKISIDYDATAASAEIKSMVIWSGDSFLAESDCNTKNKCVFSKVTLTKWGGD